MKQSLKEWALQNDLSILEQWDYDKNSDIDIEKIGYCSQKEVFWICPDEGHSYQARICKRVKGHRCIYCCNRALLVGYNDLLTRCPDIAIDWDYEKNDKNPQYIKFSSSENAFWKCHTCGYRWEAKISNRAYNHVGCKECGKIQSIEKRKNIQREKTGGFSKNYPDLLQDWDYEKNIGVDPYKLNISDKNVYMWKCRDANHSFPATITYRRSNDACVYCSNKKLLIGFNDFQTKRMDLLEEWDYEKNDCSPNKILFTNHKTVINWKCKYCGAEIQSTLANHKTLGCRSCKLKNRHAKNKANRIEFGAALNKEVYPELYLDWDFKENEKESIFWEQTLPSYSSNVNWKCHTCGYKWKAPVNRRIREKSGCRACKNLVVHTGFNDLETKMPELLVEWSEKNEKSPKEVLAGSDKRYIWNCRYCGHEWRASIHNRKNEGSNCPRCSGNNTSFAEQAIFYYIKQFYSDAINRYIDKESNLELDIYIPSKKYGIEYDGYRYHKDKVDRDSKKNEIFTQKGIRLVRIRETDIDGKLLPKLKKECYLTVQYKYSSKHKGLDEVICTILSDMKVVS